MKSSTYKIFLCHYLNPITDTKSLFIKNAAIILKKDKNGDDKILHVGKAKKILKQYADKKSTIIINRSQYLMMPSFFDMHFHWVQDDVREKPKTSLLKWLQNYTWPYEAKFKNKNFSKIKAKEFSNKLLSVGTLGGACYSSIHSHALEDAHREFIGNFIVGNVLMDLNSPKELLQTKADALQLVTKLSQKYQKDYAFTPRFALSTSPELMKEGAKIIKKHNSFIQTHLSENTFEIKTILELYRKMKAFKNVKSYTEIYKKCHLLGEKSIFGHGIHLNKQELLELQKSKSNIAHCPSSNAPVREKGLGSGLFNFQLIEKMNIPWALGSDIGAGPFLSMFDVISSFVIQNKKNGNKKATYQKGLYRATLAGAKMLKYDRLQGNLDKGKYANFIFINLPAKSCDLPLEKMLETIIEKNRRGKNRDKKEQLVRETYFRGKLLFKR